MATFPSLIPSDAPITPGAWPSTITSSLNGAESRIRHGSAPIGGRWRPQFVNITEANFLAILAHYRGQRSGFDSFGFDAATLAADRTPAGFAWLYAGPPQVVDEHNDVFTVQCEFKCEPRGLVVAPGGAWRTGATRFAEIDPHFSSVSLLLEFEGANGSTTFTDLGPLGLPVVREYGGEITTELAAAGSSSFRVAGGQLRLPVSSALELSGDFTLEWSPRHTNIEGKQQYFCNFEGTNVQIGYLDALYFYIGGDVYRSLSLSVNIWDTLMISRSGSTLYWGKNGTILGTATDTGNYNLSGGNIARYGSQNMQGFLDRIRITKGVCRYTSDYFVSPGPFPRG